MSEEVSSQVEPSVLNDKVGGGDGNIVFMGEGCADNSALASCVVVLVSSKFKVVSWIHIVDLGDNLVGLDHVTPLTSGSE